MIFDAAGLVSAAFFFGVASVLGQVRRMIALFRQKSLWRMPGTVLCLTMCVGTANAERILFVGNSFTFGAGSAVQTFRPGSVHDLNHGGLGGVPALFKAFATQAGLDWDVSQEAVSGQDFAFHLANKRAELSGNWDAVVLQDYSTLDRLRPGDAAAHVRDAIRLAMLIKTANPSARVMLETTWPRADLIYPAGTNWHGKPIGALTEEIAQANATAIETTGALFAGTLPVGEAWLRAIDRGVADPDPYDGLEADKVDLWTADHYHASTAGYYLAALVIFGRVTGMDPRRLGVREQAAQELGLTPPLRPLCKTLQVRKSAPLSNASSANCNLIAT